MSSLGDESKSVSVEAGLWEVPSLADPIRMRPANAIVPPNLGSPQLPFSSLPWEDFERLLWMVMHDVEGLRDARIYGTRGQTQHGLDVVALTPGKSGVALQAKRYEKFTAKDLDKAVQKFTSSTRPFSVGRLIIAASPAVQDTGTVKSLARHRESLVPLAIDFWDAVELSRMLKDRPQIVIDFFGIPMAERFCVPFTLAPKALPPVHVVRIGEAIAVTPESLTGADKRFVEAKRPETAPAEALALIEEGQKLLRDAGFKAHAAKLTSERARILAQIGRIDEGARELLDELWTALDRGQTLSAQATRNRLEELAEIESESAASPIFRAVAQTAIGLYFDPLADLPEASTLRVGSKHDQLRLAVLAGEIALANDNLEWLNSALPHLTEISGDESTDFIWRTRLRLIIAETTSEWKLLLGEARKLKLGHQLKSLVSARYARYCANAEQFEEADECWEDACGAASLAERWEDASTYVLNRRALSSRWKPFVPDDLLSLEIALSDMGPSTPILPVAARASEAALDALRKGDLRQAAIAGQRALRDTVARADWNGENRARQVLAAILIEADEPRLAARHLARAGAVNEIDELGRNYPNKFIDILSDLDGRNYWTVGAVYRLIAAQADLVPDGEVERIANLAVAELRAAETYSRTDAYPSNSSRYLNAVKALAGIAHRTSEQVAESILAHFERQDPVAPGHYRYHDNDEAGVVSRILSSRPSLAHRAITHLLPLLDRGQGSRQSAVLESVRDNMPIARELLTTMAASGSSWASTELALAEPVNTDPIVAQQALDRLSSRRTKVPGVISYGTGAVRDSLLVGNISSIEASKAVGELLARAEDLDEPAENRGDYLVAASNLATATEGKRRRKLFEQALRLATAPTPLEAMASDGYFSHKLSPVQIGGSSIDTHGQAVLLASSLAMDQEHRVRVRNAVHSLLGRESDYWPARALQRLGDSVNDDLPFLAGQGWAIRCLAALHWPKVCDPAHLGARLAHDPDVRVRQALAQAVGQEQFSSKLQSVRAILAEDAAHSVRAALGVDPRSDSI